MKYDNYFVIELIVPTEIICSIESGYLDLRLCKKVENGFLDIENNNVYQLPNNNKCLIGTKRINKIIPLKEYYNCLSLKNNKDNYRATEVYKLVKTLKASKRI